MFELPLNINIFCSNFFCQVSSLNGTKLGVQSSDKQNNEKSFFHMFKDHPTVHATWLNNLLHAWIPLYKWPRFDKTSNACLLAFNKTVSEIQ